MQKSIINNVHSGVWLCEVLRGRIGMPSLSLKKLIERQSELPHISHVSCRSLSSKVHHFSFLLHYSISLPLEWL